MATRKLNVSEMREETKNIETEVSTLENGLSSLDKDVLDIFPEGWNSDNAAKVLRNIQNMRNELAKIKDATRVIRERIDTHIGEVESQDIVSG